MTSTPAVPTRQDRRARAAVAALFLTNGALFANLIPRYPEIKAGLDLGDATYGLALAAFPAGAIAAGLAAGALVRRFGSARTAVAGTALTALGVLGAGSAPGVAALAGVLALAGAMDAVTDVAQNAHGLRVQRRYGRSIINGFHALWSIGAVLGGSAAAGAIALDLPLPVHLGVSGAVFVAVALVALRFLLPGPDGPGEQVDVDVVDAAEEAASVRRRRPVVGPRTALVLAALVVVAVGGTLVEDAGNTWGALYLSRSLEAPATVAAFGYIALVGAQTVGRLVGDRLVDRFGQRAVARTGALVAAVGMGAALAVPTVAGTVAGFGLAGLGVATLVPAAMQQADALPGLRPGTGLTLVSWLMRLGFLASPPLVGLVADSAGLRVGLLVVPLAGVAVAVLAQVLPGRGDRGSLDPQPVTVGTTSPRA
ncbi:MFS transporter [Pseudokineococcus basanitobsidens]|uniref:MFS transporter n=1 Tax=Pseudokineococcus basanitobsidens TaxID=1926649 RepID=A0ABU8RN13_9ACTN